MDTKNKLLTAAAVSTFFILTVFVFAPSHAFLTNLVEFNIFYSELLRSLALIAVPSFLLIVVLLLRFSPEKPVIHQRGVTLILSLSFLLWLQGNVLVWNYGQLNGRGLSFNEIFVIIDAIIWTGVIVFVFVKAAFFYKHAKILSCTFIVIQLISTSILIHAQPKTLSFKEYELDDANEFIFSKEKNVIIFLLDTFQSELFQEIINEDESYKDIFEGFVYFRNAVGGFPITYASVPNILTSQYYDNTIPVQEFLKKAYTSPESIPRVLKENGFQVDYFGPLRTMYCDNEIISNLKPRQKPKSSNITFIFDAALFRYLPDSLKNYIYNDGRWFLRDIVPYTRKIFTTKDASGDKKSRITFDKMALGLPDVRFISNMMAYSNVVDGKYIFKYYHLIGCHSPFLMNENMEYEKQDSREGQAKGSLKITKIFLDELKRLQVFDNSMIFIIADHGPAETLRTSASPLILVKKFNGKGQMTISEAPVSLSDIPKTIFLELGLEGQFNGESVFNLQESSFRERRYLYFKWWSPGFDGTREPEYVPRMDEYLITGHAWSDDSWKATGRKFIPKGFDKFVKARQIPVFLKKDEMNVVLVKLDDVLEKEPDFYTELGENWSFERDGERWTTSDTASIIVKTDSEGKQAGLYLQYTPLREDNALSVYLNGIKVKDCENNHSCSINNLTFKKGENILELKARLPAARLEGSSDLRKLCYKFQVIEFTVPYFILPAWKDGFFDLEGTAEQNWRWCSSEGILEINNTFSHKKKIILDMSFSNYSFEKSNLSIESDLFSEQLQVNVEGTPFQKEIMVPTGKHIIKFICDAKRPEVPWDSRFIVFRINNFKLMEKSGNLYYKTTSN